MKKAEDKEKSLVTKSNSLNEARYRLTVMEQKLVLAVVSLIQPEDEDFKTYRIKIAELIELLDLKGGSLYSEVEKSVKELMKRVIEIPMPENSSKLVTNWFSSAKYMYKQGYVKFRFDPYLKPYLLKLKERFVSYKLKNVIQLKSYYSIRIYELLKQYEKMGYRTFALDELKEILGIGAEEYKLYNHFKSRVLMVAHEEIPKKTDLDFSFIEIKEGRKVAFIKFDIHSGKKKLDSEKVVDDKIEVTIEILNDAAFVSLIDLLPEEQKEKKTILDTMANWYKKEGVDYVARNIKYTNSNCSSNYRVYLSKALKGDWGVELQEDEEAMQKSLFSERELRRKEKEKVEIEEEYSKQVDDYIDENLDELRKEALARLDEDVRAKIEKNDTIARFTLTGMIRQVAEERVNI